MCEAKTCVGLVGVLIGGILAASVILLFWNGFHIVEEYLVTGKHLSFQPIGWKANASISFFIA